MAGGKKCEREISMTLVSVLSIFQHAVEFRQRSPGGISAALGGKGGGGW